MYREIMGPVSNEERVNVLVGECQILGGWFQCQGKREPVSWEKAARL